MENTEKIDFRDRGTRQFFYGVILVVVLSVLGVRSCIRKENEEWNNVEKPKVIGTVTWIDDALRGEDDAVVTFYVDNNKFEIGIGTQAVIGEKFIVEYDIKNPSYNKVSRGNPLFLRGEKTKLTIARLSNFVTVINGYMTYDYKIENDFYEHSIWVSDSIKQNFPDVKKGDYFKVEYWEENPNRSVIYLDKPVDSFIGDSIFKKDVIQRESRSDKKK